MENKTNTDPSITENKPDTSKILFISCKIKRIKNWSPEEDQLLLTTAEAFSYRNWKAISENFADRTPIQCSARYKRIRPGIVKGPWSVHEDMQLEDLVSQYGNNWSLIAKFMPSRSGKQIRDRFLNALDPKIIKDKFTIEEDKRIIELYTKYGTAWSKIAKSFKGRTGDMIKNRFYSSLRRKIHSFDQYRVKLNKNTSKKKIKKDNLKQENNEVKELEEALKGKSKLLNF